MREPRDTSNKWHFNQEGNVLSLMKAGHNMSEIADAYGVSRQSVSAFINSRPVLSSFKKAHMGTRRPAWKKTNSPSIYLATNKEPHPVPVGDDLSKAVKLFTKKNGVRKFRTGESGQMEFLIDFLTVRGYRVSGYLGTAWRVRVPDGSLIIVSKVEFIALVDRIRIEEGREPILMRA